MYNRKSFEIFDFNGIKVCGSSYTKKFDKNNIVFVCEARDGDIIHKTQNIDYGQCVNDLKELYFIRRYIAEISTIPVFN